MQKNIRLKTKINIISASLLTLSLILSCIIFSILTLNIYTKDSIEVCQRDLALGMNSLESTLSHIANYSISAVSDSRVIETAKLYPNGPQSDTEKARLRQSLGKNISSIISPVASIYMWDLFSMDGTAFGVSGNDITRLVPFFDVDFFQKASSTNSCQIFGPYLFESSTIRLPMFIFTKTIVDLDTRKPHGLLIMAVLEKHLSSVFTQNSASQSTFFSIIDAHYQIVSCKNSELIGVNIEEYFNLNQSAYERLLATGQTDIDGNGNSLLLLSQPTEDYVSWRILMEIHMNIKQTIWKNTLINIILIAAIICILLSILSYYISRFVTRPINNLSHSIQLFAENVHLTPFPDPGGGYEINILYRCFNDLLARIRSLIAHIHQEQEEKSNYKFQLIQAQIKPHFLYNTLMTIKSLIDLGMNETAGECIYAMSSFYRLSLNKGNDILTLADEIELSQQYMYIQKLRYIDRLDYIFDIPRCLYDCLLPKMTLQPILENAIYHGIKEKACKGVIEVVGRDKGDHMEFSISDNGNGMNAQELEKLRAALEADNREVQPRNASFGLLSVNRRIRMLYGDQYGVYIDSHPGQYTVVTLILPKNTEFGGINL